MQSVILSCECIEASYELPPALGEIVNQDYRVKLMLQHPYLAPV
jgi:hypothetical protein